MKNLFLVHTEYHFMLAVQIICSVINDENSENIILFVSSKDRRTSIVLKNYANIKALGIESPLTLKSIKPYLEDNFSNFYYFQNGDIKNRWITWQLKRKGTVINLIQDGMAAYCYNESILRLPNIIRDTLLDYQSLKKGKFSINKLFITNKFRYGYNSATDKLLLTNPEKFDRKKRGSDKEIIKIPQLDNASQEMLWQFLPKSNFQHTENIVLIINQPLWSDALFEADMDFIKSLVTKFPESKIYMKPHPLTNKKYYDAYKDITGVEIVNSTIPVELMMQNLKNSIVVSGYSTALIANSAAEANNRYYYYFPIYKKTGDKAMRRKQIVVFEHIKVVDSAEHIY